MNNPLGYIGIGGRFSNVSVKNAVNIGDSTIKIDGSSNTVETLTTNGDLTLKANGTGIVRIIPGVDLDSIKMTETGAGTDTVTIQPPVSIPTSYTITLPADDGTAGLARWLLVALAVFFGSAYRFCSVHGNGSHLH